METRNGSKAVAAQKELVELEGNHSSSPGAQRGNLNLQEEVKERQNSLKQTNIDSHGERERERKGKDTRDSAQETARKERRRCHGRSWFCDYQQEGEEKDGWLAVCVAERAKERRWKCCCCRGARPRPAGAAGERKKPKPKSQQVAGLKVELRRLDNIPSPCVFFLPRKNK
ncbi:hypothetical protein CRG98_026505 [Punica granatum]|uniref:Uncharacterized protein n=1 Tax=Punica granatum TaxID=22663 RepID=A0A2I0JB15_PUNGR|nr:hypothetical protein CRG98_026505 [Punica granatum]